MNDQISALLQAEVGSDIDDASCLCSQLDKGKPPMVTRYAKTTWAIALGLVLLLSPFIGFNASASPLLQGTPTVISRTPTVPISPIPGATIDGPSYSGSLSTASGEKYYQVKTGDTLWSIATNVYGNGALYQLIQQANGLPDKAILKIGSKLLIPSVESATSIPTPSPQGTDDIKQSSTPVSQDIASIPTHQPSSLPTLPVVSSPTATGIPVLVETVSAKPAKDNGQEWSSMVRYIQLSILLLSIACFLSSLYCAYLSFEIYQRHRPYIRRRDIRNRVRAGL